MFEKNRSDNLKEGWLLEDMFAFENVGFSKGDQIKYLTCAACEVGPLGFHIPGTKRFILCHDRVSFKN